MTGWMAKAIAGLLLFGNFESEAFAVLLGHHAILRTMEAAGPHVGEFVLRLLLGSGYLNLPDTKTSTRHGRAEAVILDWHELVHWCAKLCEGMAPGDKLLKNSIGRLRKHFVTAVKVFDGKTSRPEFAALLDRTNGATEHVHKTGFMRGQMDQLCHLQTLQGRSLATEGFAAKAAP